MRDVFYPAMFLFVVLVVAVGVVWLSNKVTYATMAATDYIDSRTGQRYLVFTSEHGLFVIKAEPDKGH